MTEGRQKEATATDLKLSRCKGYVLSLALIDGNVPLECVGYIEEQSDSSEQLSAISIFYFLYHGDSLGIDNIQCLGKERISFAYLM